MRLVGNNSSMQLTPLWSVDKFTFHHDLYIYKHCFLPLLLVSVIKCCVKMFVICLITLSAARFFHLCLVCLLHLLICTTIYMCQLFTHRLPTIICVMLMSIVFCYFFIFVLYFATEWLFFLSIKKSKVETSLKVRVQGM